MPNSEKDYNEGGPQWKPKPFSFPSIFQRKRGKEDGMGLGNPTEWGQRFLERWDIGENHVEGLGRVSAHLWTGLSKKWGISEQLERGILDWTSWLKSERWYCSLNIIRGDILDPYFGPLLDVPLGAQFSAKKSSKFGSRKWFSRVKEEIWVKF